MLNAIVTAARFPLSLHKSSLLYAALGMLLVSCRLGGLVVWLWTMTCTYNKKQFHHIFPRHSCGAIGPKLSGTTYSTSVCLQQQKTT